MPPWEIDNLVKALDEVHQEEARQVRLAQQSNKIGFK